MTDKPSLQQAESKAPDRASPKEPKVSKATRWKKLKWPPFKAMLTMAYVAVLLAGGATLTARIWFKRSASFGGGPRHAFAHYVTTRNLSANHRLEPGDFTTPSDIPSALAVYLPDDKYLIGRYLRDDRGQGLPILPDMLLIRPMIKHRAEGEIRLVPLAEQAHVWAWIDAGIGVQVNTEKGPLNGSVAAVTCPDPEAGKPVDPATCAALVVVPRPQTGDASTWKLEPRPAK